MSFGRLAHTDSDQLPLVVWTIIVLELLTRKSAYVLIISRLVWVFFASFDHLPEPYSMSDFEQLLFPALKCNLLLLRHYFNSA